MKVTVLSESPADEAGIRILVEGILGRNTEVGHLPSLLTRGWSPIIRLLPALLTQLHYTTDTEALIVIVDSDDSPVHQNSHDEVGGADMNCRLCQLRSVVDSTKARLRPVSGRGLIKTGIGLAIPSIEAWYRCGIDTHVNEATWSRHLQGEPITYTRRTLKADAYGTDRPSIDISTTHAIAAAKRLVEDMNLLETLFPIGFGYLVREIRGW